MLLLQHAIITTLIALVASVLHFMTQHKLTTSKGESNTCYLICYSYYMLLMLLML